MFLEYELDLMEVDEEDNKNDSSNEFYNLKPKSDKKINQFVNRKIKRDRDKANTKCSTCKKVSIFRK